MDNETFNPENYWNTRLKDRWGLHGVGSYDLGRYYNQWLYLTQKKVFLRNVKQLPLELNKSNVLDIGSGTGFYVELWKSVGVKSVTATDITTVSVEKLKMKFPDVDCYKLDVGNTLPVYLQDKSYDIVSAFAVLYHIIDDEHYQKAFENVYEMLRPHGIFIFSENFTHGKTVRGEHEVDRSLIEIEAIAMFRTDKPKTSEE